MRVWVDTEFSDFQQPKLISIGLVSECGEELYVVIAEGQQGGWRRSDCLEWVVEHIVPTLEIEFMVTIEEAARRVRDYLVRVRDEAGVDVYADYSTDLALVRSLLLSSGFDYSAVGGIATWHRHPLGMYGQSVADEILERSRRHHALDDARAYRAGRLAEEAALRADFGEP